MPIKFIDVPLSLQNGILCVNILAKLLTSCLSKATPVAFGKCHALILSFLGDSTSDWKLSPICNNSFSDNFKSSKTYLYKAPLAFVSLTSDDK